MLWVLSLHIMSLSIWTAAALYIPLLLYTNASQHRTRAFEGTPRGIDSIARFAYTHIATPFAIISISAGTVVFLLNQSADFWLLAKLTLVTVLVVVQACLGLLIIRAEREQWQGIRPLSLVIGGVFSVLMIVIVWIVLAKPAEPAWWVWSIS